MLAALKRCPHSSLLLGSPRPPARFSMGRSRASQEEFNKLTVSMQPLQRSPGHLASYLTPVARAAPPCPEPAVPSASSVRAPAPLKCPSSPAGGSPRPLRSPLTFFQEASLNSCTPGPGPSAPFTPISSSRGEQSLDVDGPVAAGVSGRSRTRPSVYLLFLGVLAAPPLSLPSVTWAFLWRQNSPAWV